MPPAAAALGSVGAAAGVLPGVIAAATGAGKSKAAVGNFAETPNYNPNAFNYGGTPGGAQAAETKFGQTQEGYAGQANDQLNQANTSYGLGLQARGQQEQAQNMLVDRAQGKNLISTQIGNANRTDLAARMHSAAASAQGPAALANAQSDAMAAGAQGDASISRDETTAGMQEQQQAELAAMQGATGIRAGDTATQGLGLTGYGTAGGLGAQYGGLQNQVAGQQLEGGIAGQKILASSQANEDNTNSGTQAANAAQDLNYIKMSAGGAQGGAQTALMAGQPSPAPPKAAAKGGPIDTAQPVLVGEKGPELILPTHDAFVLTAPQTQQVLHRAGGGYIPGLDLGDDPLAKMGPGLGNPSGSGGGVDMGNAGSINGAMVNAGSTGTQGATATQPVGGGGITGGNMGDLGMPGGMQSREEGGPIKGYGHADNDTGNHLQRRGAAGDVVSLHGLQEDSGVSADEHEPSTAERAGSYLKNMGLAFAAGPVASGLGLLRREDGGPIPGYEGPPLKNLAISELGDMPAARNPVAFKRDTPADQQAAGKQYRDADAARMMQEADALSAGMNESLAAGPSARRLASGTPDNYFETELTRGAEQAYQRKYGADEGADYDLRGAHAAGLTDQTKPEYEILDDGKMQPVFRGHLPDTFKKPNHSTFSDESQYAADAPAKAGHWKGDRYQAPEERPEVDDLHERLAALEALAAQLRGVHHGR